jgi:hypothetical protein
VTRTASEQCKLRSTGGVVDHRRSPVEFAEKHPDDLQECARTAKIVLQPTEHNVVDRFASARGLYRWPLQRGDLADRIRSSTVELERGRLKSVHVVGEHPCFLEVVRFEKGIAPIAAGFVRAAPRPAGANYGPSRDRASPDSSVVRLGGGGGGLEASVLAGRIAVLEACNPPAGRSP